MTDADRPVFAQAVAQLAVATREAKVDEVLLRVYWEHLQAWPAELVLAAAERLALGAYFPKVGEWRSAVIVIERERQAAQRAVLRRLRDPLCAICRDTGWAHRDDGRVQRCACAADRRLEVLGQRALPLVSPIDPTMQQRGADAMCTLESQVREVVATRTMPKTWAVKAARIQQALERGDRSPQDDEKVTRPL